VALFAACPRRYYLERYLGWETQPRATAYAASELPATEFGLQAHSLLAGVPVVSPHPEAVRLTELFRASTIGRRAARATRIEREFDFLLAVEDMVLRGQIDLWFEEKGELILVDYKTDAVPTAHEAEQHARAYGEQLRLYAMALERIAGRLPDQAYIYFLRRNEAIPADLSPLALEATRNLVREMRDAQEKLAFPLQTGDHCVRCPYFHNLCPAEVISLSSCVEPLPSLSSLSS
jgi:CRISPR/Cas system-associated exonuclease Cas4 (RecB family)